jgi:TATA-box binding protein (TBP) (component of TFIID and TFIIIB)
MTNKIVSLYPNINNLKVRFIVINRLTKLNLAVNKLKTLLDIVRRLNTINKTARKKRRTKKKKEIFKQCHNFIVIRGKYVISIFLNSGAVNITGIPSFKKISSAVKYFCHLFRINQRQLTPLIIDNITASGDFNQKVNLKQLKHFINGNCEKSIVTSATFNTQRFPGCICRTFSRIGTCTVFRSGKYNIVGAKCLKHIRRITREMIVLIHKL